MANTPSKHSASMPERHETGPPLASAGRFRRTRETVATAILPASTSGGGQSPAASGIEPHRREAGMIRAPPAHERFAAPPATLRTPD